MHGGDKDHIAVVLPADLGDLGKKEIDRLVGKIHINVSSALTRPSFVGITLTSLYLSVPLPALSDPLASFNSSLMPLFGRAVPVAPWPALRRARKRFGEEKRLSVKT